MNPDTNESGIEAMRASSDGRHAGGEASTLKITPVVGVAAPDRVVRVDYQVRTAALDGWVAAELARVAWAILLSRYSGEHAVRWTERYISASAESEQVMRSVHVGPDDTAEALANRVDTESLIGDALSTEIGSTSLLRRNCGTQICFVPSDYLADTKEPDGTMTEELDALSCDWSVFVSLDRDRVLGMSLMTDQATEDDARRLLMHFATLLERIAAAPQRPAKQLSMLSEAEHDSVVARPNQTARPFPSNRLLHAGFKQQANQQPERIAVATASETLTYAELNARAEVVSDCLKQMGVVNGSHVAIAMRRTADLVGALLGVLKAGGVYVPVESDWPATRVREVVSLARCEVLISSSSEAHAYMFDADQLLVDDAVEDRDRPIQHRLTVRRGKGVVHNTAVARDASLAYVIFTSGSTGRPKGVAVSHRAIANLIDWVNRTYQVSHNDRLLFTTSIAFDLSVYDLFGMLTAGGTIRIADERECADPAELLRVLKVEPVTLWDSAPAALERLVTLSNGMPISDSMRQILLSGDWVPTNLPARLRVAFRRSKLAVLGGATEATVWSNAFDVERVDPDWQSIPYGRPIQNARYYVLAPDLTPVPTRVPGELYIAGVCLSEGYVSRPDLSSASFLRHDALAATPERLYKTGDQVTRWDDGTLEILGRLDDQVKVRGYRIELGEIDATLQSFDEVERAVTLAIGDPRGSRSLVAFVVSATVDELDAQRLRDRLGDKLPSYMVPSQVRVIETLPLTANGKVDRASLLRSAEQYEPEWERALVPAGSVTQKVLLDAWSAVLGSDQIDIYSNFFHRGGDSLSAIDLICRAEREGIVLTLPMLIEHPTVASLSKAVQAHESVDTTEVPFAVLPSRSLVSPPQAWFFGRRLQYPERYQVAAFYTLDQPIQTRAMRRAVAALAQRHDALRTRFEFDNDRWWQHVELATADYLSFFETVSLDVSEGPSLDQALTDLVRRVQEDICIKRGKTWRVVLVQTSDRTMDRMLMVFHHLIIDALSLDVVTSEVMELYRAICACQEPDLQPVGSIQRWSESAFALATTPGIASEIERFQKLPWERVHPLPLDQPSGENRYATTVETTAMWDKAPSALGRDDLRVADVLFACLSVSLSTWTNQHVVLIDYSGHGRELPLSDLPVHRMVGFMSAVYPVLIQLQDGVAPESVLHSVTRQRHEMPLSGTAYGACRYAPGDTEVARCLAGLPGSEVKFNFVPIAPNRSDNLRICSPRVPGIMSPDDSRRYPLNVDIFEQRDQLLVCLRYSTEQFKDDTVRLLLDQMRRFYERVAKTEAS